MSNQYEIVELDLTNDQIATLALEAHKLNITLNDYIISLLEKHIKQEAPQYYDEFIKNKTPKSEPNLESSTVFKDQGC